MNIFKNYRLYFLISLFFLVPGIYSIIRYGFKLGIDFTGGSLIEIKYQWPDGATDKSLEYQTVVDALGEINYQVESVQSSGQNQVIIRTSEIDNQIKDQLLDKLSQAIGQVELRRFETIGPSLSRELLAKTLNAVIFVSLIITVYVWRQFKNLKFGVCAVLAMFHDTLILLGAFSLLGRFMEVETDVLFVTALLTTLSFSIHDTIVVFDRIRELQHQHTKLEIRQLADVAVLETLGRSINNSVTIIIMLLALYLLGGESIKHFTLALLIGAVTGTYSSSFTAVPLLLEWRQQEKRLS